VADGFKMTSGCVDAEITTRIRLALSMAIEAHQASFQPQLVLLNKTLQIL
jgi:hypothetical protein